VSFAVPSRIGSKIKNVVVARAFSARANIVIPADIKSARNTCCLAQERGK